MVIAEIYGNDVEFYASDDARSWTAGQPSPQFDDGESSRDIACSDQMCIGVGFLDATYRPQLNANTGVAWVSSSGRSFERVDHDFGTESLDAIAWNRPGFLAAGSLGTAWQSTDGTEWSPVSAPFTHMTVDGVEALGDSYVVFGRDGDTGALTLWTSEDITQWSETVVAAGLPRDSHIRAVTGTRRGLIAAGIDGETYEILVWASPDRRDWQATAVLAPR